MQKGQSQVLILAGIVILIAVAGGIFYLGRATAPKPPASQRGEQTPVATSSPTPDASREPNGSAETVYTESDRSANWKTYTDTKNGYSFKYPSELELDTTDVGVIVSNYQKLLNSPKGVSGEEYIHINLGTYTLPDNIDFKDWVTQKTVRFLPDNTKRSSIHGEMQQYNSYGFSGFTFEWGAEEVDKAIVINMNGRIAWFTLIGYQTGSSYKDNPNAEGILDQILSTFRFLP